MDTLASNIAILYQYLLLPSKCRKFSFQRMLFPIIFHVFFVHFQIFYFPHLEYSGFIFFFNWFIHFKNIENLVVLYIICYLLRGTKEKRKDCVMKLWPCKNIPTKSNHNNVLTIPPFIKNYDLLPQK